ncbi:MAG: hypothetical protein WBQ26_12235 [Gemmatimonadaceae bacterium]|nr:hypothetical protein [Gemmatimonadaceae bacterium]
MKGSWFVMAVTLTVVGAGAARAQSSACPSGAQGTATQVSQDACQQAVDVFQYMAPQLGAAVAGGNATLGQGGTLGGFGHFSVGVRANVVAATLPQVDAFQQSVTGAQRQTLPTKDNQPLPMPVADAAIGLWSGIPVGVTNVGGVDALVNVAYIPDVTQNGLSVKAPNGSLKFGYGVRVGIIQESIALPGVAVTYLKRDLPAVTLEGASGFTTFMVSNVNIGTTAYRLVASKHFVVFGLAAGVGQDKYSQSADVQATVLGQTSPTVSLSQDVTRTNMFADLSLNLPILTLVGEVGQVSGGSVSTYNQFSKDANASRLYGSVGLRLGW